MPTNDRRNVRQRCKIMRIDKLRSRFAGERIQRLAKGLSLDMKIISNCCIHSRRLRRRDYGKDKRKENYAEITKPQHTLMTWRGDRHKRLAFTPALVRKTYRAGKSVMFFLSFFQKVPTRFNSRQFYYSVEGCLRRTKVSSTRSTSTPPMSSSASNIASTSPVSK